MQKSIEGISKCKEMIQINEGPTTIYNAKPDHIYTNIKSFYKDDTLYRLIIHTEVVFVVASRKEKLKEMLLGKKIMILVPCLATKPNLTCGATISLVGTVLISSIKIAKLNPII